jgi:hypothetical protein
MTQDQFIEKWNVGYEDFEQKAEFAQDMKNDLASLKLAEGSQWVKYEVGNLKDGDIIVAGAKGMTAPVVGIYKGKGAVLTIESNEYWEFSPDELTHYFIPPTPPSK